MIGFFNGVGNFFGTLFGNWQGLLIGLAIAAIIVLVLALTVFKNNSFALKFFGIILTLALSIGGAFLQVLFFADPHGKLPSVEEVISITNNTLKADYKNTNGFTVKQVRASQDELSCPTAEDEYIDITLQDYGDYVCFYYKETFLGFPLYRNVTFLKSENGLIRDGLLNSYCKYPTKDVGWIFTSQIDYNNINWTIDYFNLPAYKTTYLYSYYSRHNLVSISTSKPYLFCHERYGDHFLSFGCINKDELSYNLLKDAAVLCGSNISNFHISWNDNIELTGLRDDVVLDVNTFYTYLYNAVQNEEYNTNKLIDGAGYICKVIPEEERCNYPVSDEFKEKYPDIDYYSVYRCNLGVNLTYVEGNKLLETDDDRQKEFVEKDKDNIGETTPPQEVFSLSCKFKDVSTEEHTLIPDLSENPIEIVFSNGTLNHSLIVSDFNDLNRSIPVILKANGLWNYTIKSNRVIFPAYTGTFEITSSKSLIEFNYEYYDDYVPYTIELQSITSVYLSELDISSNPVKVILINNNNQYTFTFDSLEKLTSGIIQEVKFGDYNYTIVSDLLLFEPENGTLTVSTVNTEFVIHFSVNNPLDDISLNLVVEENTTAYDRLIVDQTSVSIASAQMVEPGAFNLEILIYDVENTIMSTCVYTHNGSSSIDTVNINLLGLEIGSSYYVRVNLIDVNNENLIYTSNIVTFDRDLTTGEVFTLTITSNK